MRVLVTGGGGTLGRALAPLLVNRGHKPVLFDLDPPVLEGVVAHQGDVRSLEDVGGAMDQIDVVVHAAAIHGIHLASRPAADFFELNIRGTFNVWEAAAASGVKGVVFCSTMGVYGDSRKPAADDQVAIVREDLPLLPADVYGYSKLVGEEMCRFQRRARRIPSVALRLGMFVPEPFFRYGIRLLYGGVDERDAAGAVMKAIDHVASGAVGYEAFNVESTLPFSAEDAPDLRRDPLEAVERHYPGARGLLEERGVTNLNPITELFPMARIGEGLRFHPEHNFGEWLEELRGRDDRSEHDPPWP